MIKYSKANVTLTDTQFKKLKSAYKNEKGTTLRMSLEMFDGSDLAQKLLLTTRQASKANNALIRQ